MLRLFIAACVFFGAFFLIGTGMVFAKIHVDTVVAGQHITTMMVCIMLSVLCAFMAWKKVSD